MAFNYRKTNRLPARLGKLRDLKQTVAVNAYKNGPSLRLCINWKWHESVFLVLAKGKHTLGTRFVAKITPSGTKLYNFCGWHAF